MPQCIKKDFVAVLRQHGIYFILAYQDITSFPEKFYTFLLLRIYETKNQIIYCASLGTSLFALA